MAQWLRLRTPNAGAPGLIPGSGTRFHMLQLSVHMPQLKILYASTKTLHTQTNINIKKKNMENKNCLQKRSHISFDYALMS